MLACGISGEVPREPVVLRKSGRMYERRLIEAYLDEHGTDPVTGEASSVDELVAVQTQSSSIPPRPPSVTSIPSLLAVFQNEWDGIALETYTLKQQLAQTRQELSTALYQNDAAARLIARLMKERDEAREALAKFQITAPVSQEDHMDTLTTPRVPPHISELVESTHTSLSSARRKRKVPADWVHADQISSYTVRSLSTRCPRECDVFEVDHAGQWAIVGGKHASQVVSITDDALVQELNAGIVSGAWHGSTPVTAGADGVVTIWNDSPVQVSTNIPLVALALHPSGDLLGFAASTGEWGYIHIRAASVVCVFSTDAIVTCAAFHPDGHLFALGTHDGKIRLFSAKDGEHAADLVEGPDEVTGLSFAENGYSLAVTSSSTPLSIWDLRKQTKTVQLERPCRAVRFEASAGFLAGAGQHGGVCIWGYVKAEKTWRLLLEQATPALQALGWGASGQWAAGVTVDGDIQKLCT